VVADDDATVDNDWYATNNGLGSLDVHRSAGRCVRGTLGVMKLCGILTEARPPYLVFPITKSQISSTPLHFTEWSGLKG
jgi:hypothetical protein